MKISTFITLATFLPKSLVDFLWRAYIKAKGGQLILPALPDPKTMTLEELNAEIALATGWKMIKFPDEVFYRVTKPWQADSWTEMGDTTFKEVIWCPSGSEIRISESRHWVGSLNAMGEVEDLLTRSQRVAFIDALAEDNGWDAWKLVHADAETRARAWVIAHRVKS